MAFRLRGADPASHPLPSLHPRSSAFICGSKAFRAESFPTRDPDHSGCSFAAFTISPVFFTSSAMSAANSSDDSVGVA